MSDFLIILVEKLDRIVFISIGDKLKQQKPTPTAGGGVQINCMGEFSNFKDYNIEERESLLFPAVGRTSKHKFLELQMKKGHNHRVRRNKNY